MDRMPALDGLRGAAIVLVFFYHVTTLSNATLDNRAGYWLQNLLGSGWSGVDLFFVLSGFLITRILLKTRLAPRYFRTFYMRRTLRIFPLYYIAVVALLFVLPEMSIFERSSYFGQWPAWCYALNLVIATHGFSTLPLQVQHFWSLAVEEQFYLAWPLIIYFTPTLRIRLVLSIILCAAALAFRIIWFAEGRHYEGAYVLLPARMDALAFGALAALVHGRRSARIVRFLGVAAAFGLIGCFVRLRGLCLGGETTMTYVLTLFGVAFSGLVSAAAQPETAICRMFTGRILQTLGRYSYAIYVFHVPVLIWMRLYGVVDAVTHSALPVLLLTAVIAGGLTTCLAAASWLYIERPLLNLKARFRYVTAPGPSHQSLA